MLFLPLSPTPPSRTTIPVSAWAATRLARGLLMSGEPRRELFQQALLEEPGLAIWVACRTPLDSPCWAIRQQADWLARNAGDTLCGLRLADPGQFDSFAWPELAAEAVTVARLAAGFRLAGALDHKAADSSLYLRGLLHQGRRWLVGENSSEPDAAPPPFAKEQQDQLRIPGVTAEEDEETENELAAAIARVAAQPPSQRLRRTMRGRWIEIGSDDLAGSLPELLQLRQQLDVLTNGFQRELEREKLSSLRELAYGASHEINNPLANISTRAQTLLRDERDPERRRKLATISAQAFRAHEMISDMMLFAKPPQPTPTDVDLVRLIDTVMNEIQPTAREQGTELEREGLERPLLLRADEAQLAMVLKALVRNSLEAIGLGGRVVIAAHELSEEQRYAVEISVRDTGPGIPTAVRPHLFDPFYSGREAGRGLGFGLSKCWRIVELHHGVIEVGQSENGGAQFTIRLPAELKPCPPIRSAG